MDKDVAQSVAMTAARCSSEIGGLALLVKQHCSADEYEVISAAIGSAVYELREGLMGAIFKLVPELEAEFEMRVEKYGRSFY